MNLSQIPGHWYLTHKDSEQQHTTDVKTENTFQDTVNYQQTSLHIMTVEFLAQQSLVV